MARNRISRCCCEPPSCVLFEDDFDRSDSSSVGSSWTELVGDWEIAGNEMSIDSTGAFIRCEDVSQSDLAVVVDVTPASNGDKARIFVRMDDEDTCVVVEVEFGTSSSTVRLYNRTSGSDGSALDTAASSSVTVGSTYQVTVCVESGVVSAVVASSAGERFIEASSSGAGSGGSKTGLGTGGTVATSITFNDFMILTRNDECEICGICNPLPFTDDFATLDANWSVTNDVTIAGGAVVIGGSSASVITRCVKAPTGSDWTFTGQLTFVDVIDRAPVGTWLVYFLLRSGIFTTVQISARYSIAASGKWDIALTGAGTNTNTTATTSQQPADGSVMKFVMTENGDGTYDVSFYDDTTLLATHTGGTVPGASEWSIEIGTTGAEPYATLDDFSLVQT